MTSNDGRTYADMARELAIKDAERRVVEVAERQAVVCKENPRCVCDMSLGRCEYCQARDDATEATNDAVDELRRVRGEP